jgi:phosphate uptake regulator
VTGAIVEGVPIEPAVAERIMRLQATDGQRVGAGSDAPSGAALDTTGNDALNTALDDAVDEAVFVDQREVETREQRHFERAIGQLERFVDDKVLVCRRERSSLAEKLQSARARRDAVVGSTARDRVEAEIAALAARDDSLERRISALESREDEVYRKWRNDYHERRYQAPTVTRLFQVVFRIVPATRANPC